MYVLPARGSYIIIILEKWEMDFIERKITKLTNIRIILVLLKFRRTQLLIIVISDPFAKYVKTV